VIVLLFVADTAMGAWERLTELPEVAAFAADRVGQLLLAVFVGLIALTVAYLVTQHGRWVLVVVVLGTIGVLGVVTLTGRPPHGLPRRVPWRLGLWPRLRWLDRPAENSADIRAAGHATGYHAHHGVDRPRAALEAGR
jgi:hypothetical protein